MTIREKICEAGVSTLRQYLCLENTGGVLGDIIINSELVKVEEQEPIRIIEYVEKVGIIEVEEIVVTDYDPTDEINEEKDEVNVVC